MAGGATARADGKAPRTPRYRELADDLRRAIMAGELDATIFPTENILCQRYTVSRFTVREALRALQDEGLIQRRRGSGTVLRPGLRPGTVHEPLSSVPEILNYARDTRVRFEPQGAAPLPRRLADQLGVAGDALWPRFSGLHRRHGDEPVALIDAYIHPTLAGAAARLDLRRGALFRQIERLAGVTAVQLAQDIRAVAATKAIAAELGVPRGTPCLRILRSYIDGDGRILEIAVSHHPGDRFAFSIKLDIGTKRVATS